MHPRLPQTQVVHREGPAPQAAAGARTGDGRQARPRDRALLVQRAVHGGIERRDHVVAEVAAQARRLGRRRAGALRRAGRVYRPGGTRGETLAAGRASAEVLGPTITRLTRRSTVDGARPAQGAPASRARHPVCAR